VVLDQSRLRGARHVTKDVARHVAGHVANRVAAHVARPVDRRRFDAEAIELGNEPPLLVDGGNGGLIDRRRLSLQWFSGTILTGLCGAALMGGAVFASLDGETTFASAPERVEVALRGALTNLGDRLGGFRKADRLPAVSEPSVSLQILRVPTSTRVNNRELVRTRAYVRVSGNLSLTVSDLSANIPPFNPQKLLADAVGGGDDQTPAAEPDAEVSFVTCDLAAGAARGKVAPAVCDIGSLVARIKPSTMLPLDDVLTRVRDVANAAAADPSAVAAADATSSLRMSYAAEGDPTAGFGFEARVVPENVTLLPKTSQGNGASDWSERLIIAKKSETIGSILRELGAAPDEIKQILTVFGPAAAGTLKEGQRLRVLMAPAGVGHMQPLRVIIVGDSAIQAAAAISDTGGYVPVDIRNVDSAVADATSDTSGEDDSSGVRLYQSLYETALRNNVPNSVIEDLIRIYSYDVDFQRKVQPGDSFEVLYSDDENADGKNKVRYASVTVGGDAKKYYRFQTTDDGVYDYYDEDGKSAKKFLVRKPVAVGLVTSGFGWRTHPMLHVSELHSGVDWAAPMGTPIFAAGNGTIEEIGLKGGYGKYVRMRHPDGYETAYGHMTAFARGLDVGSKVRQGQIIGFVGSTGMSTGSHVHFEILINDRFVDPMKVKLPRGRVLDGGTLAQFQKDRDSLDSVMAHAPARVAQAH
jgi:murein DD-endopeptidase MepM/ murein hydrolase activator NlpD